MTNQRSPFDTFEGMASRSSTDEAGSVRSDGDQPIAFGRLLYQWRRRRGLSQMDLALRAETTQRHLSFIERGRSQPGRALVLRLGESLDLSLRDQNALLLEAGFAPAYPHSVLDEPRLGTVRAALQHVLDAHDPYPALIMGYNGVLVAHNEAFAVLTEGVSPELLEPPINALRLALHPRGMAPRIVNLASWSVHILERRRAAVERSPDDAEAIALLQELDNYATANRAASTEQPRADNPGTGFAVPLRFRSQIGDLNLLATRMSFATALDIALADLILEAFLPADEETMQLLASRGR